MVIGLDLSSGMRKLFFFFLFSLVVFTAYTQISLSFPMERMVFQRSNNNTGLIRIAGNFTVEYDSIMARVEVVNGGQNTAWQKIAERNDRPYFKGALQVTGGWYTLFVEGYKNGVSIGADTVQRVGMGEVFALAGQSNAAGTTAGYGVDAQDDRANVVNFSSRENDDNAWAVGFSQMSDPVSGFTSIGPSQYAMWNWGIFADLMVGQFNVPVLIYGGAYAGTEVHWWYESAYELPLTGVDNPHIDPSKKQPYGGLKAILQYYSSFTGLRAVLWHQGESDSYKGTTAQQYKFFLQGLISKSREHSGAATLAWMVARASVIYNTAYSSIRQGQNETINEDVNVFTGADTDIFLGTDYRMDGTHLNTSLGLFKHAEAWRNAIIGTNLLTNSTPVLAEDFLDVDLVCNVNNEANLTVNGIFNAYAWSNRDNTDGEATGYTSDDYNSFSMLPPTGYLRRNWQYDSTNSVTVPAGTYMVNARLASGKRVFSPLVQMASIQIPPAPTISGPTQLLQDQSATLMGSNCSGSYLWSTGSRVSEITVSPPPGNVSYSLSCKGLYCYSASTSHQLEVSDCYGQSLGVIGTAPSPTALYRTQMTLTSSQKVNSGTDATYNSGKAIVINPGFTANSGSIFKAEIKNCP